MIWFDNLELRRGQSGKSADAKKLGLARAREQRQRFPISILVIQTGNRGPMSGRPALIRQRDAKQIIAAAKKAGVPKVEVKIGEVAVILHLNAPEEKSEDEQITL